MNYEAWLMRPVISPLGLYLSAHWVGPNLRKAQGVEALTGNHVIRLAYYTA